MIYVRSDLHTNKILAVFFLKQKDKKNKKKTHFSTPSTGWVVKIVYPFMHCKSVEYVLDVMSDLTWCFVPAYTVMVQCSSPPRPLEG